MHFQSVIRMNFLAIFSQIKHICNSLIANFTLTVYRSTNFRWAYDMNHTWITHVFECFVELDDMNNRFGYKSLLFWICKLLSGRMNFLDMFSQIKHICDSLFANFKLTDSFEVKNFQMTWWHESYKLKAQKNDGQHLLSRLFCINSFSDLFDIFTVCWLFQYFRLLWQIHMGLQTLSNWMTWIIHFTKNIICFEFVDWYPDELLGYVLTNKTYFAKLLVCKFHIWLNIFQMHNFHLSLNTGWREPHICQNWLFVLNL